jgi:hypothetical protein
MFEHRLQYYKDNPILDKDGKPLTPEECFDYECDVWDCGIPGSKLAFRALWEKWGERLGIPEVYPELAPKKND